MLREENEMRAAATPSLLMLAAFPAVLFVLSAWPFLTLPPTMDSYKVLWMVRELPWWSYLTDPLSAGYAFLFHFEPLWPLLHALDAAFVPVLGGAAHHLSNVLGVLFTVLVLMRLVADVSHAPWMPLLVAALFLFSAPAWFAVAFAPMSHFPVATAFALLSVRPAWRAFATDTKPGLGESLASAAFYGLAVASKEAVAGAPLLIAGLLFAADRQPRRSILFVVPHAAVLALLLTWRVYILGGLGGYPMEAQLQLGNVLYAAPTLAALLWGHAWILVPLVVLFCLRAPGLIPVAALGYVASLAAFVFAGPIDEAGFYPVSAARLLFTWGWLLLIASLAVTHLRHRNEQLAAIALAVVLLALQWTQRGAIDTGIARLLPQENITLTPSEPTALLSSVSLAYTARHLLRPEPKATLDAYQTVPSLQLDLALGHQLPAEVRRQRFPKQLEIPQLSELDMNGIEMWVDERGRFHLRFPDELRGRLYLSWIQENDKARWVVTLLPLQRTAVDFPLNYSIRSVILSTLGAAGEPWPTHVWTSPFFRNPYPPREP